MTRKTVGVDPKLPVQAIVSLLVFVLAHFAVEVDESVELALATIVGVVAGYFAPAAKTTVDDSAVRVQA